jgi:HD superfamily phosphohydrolase
VRRGPGREIVRDLLWKNIPLEPAAARVVDTPAFQRLRYVRQLGHAFLVYPGATHSRFEHALGVYHLARRALDGLDERGDLDGFAPDDALLIRLGALLHDVGHYPFSHALEEDGAASHETLAATHLRRPPLAAALAATGLDAPVERLDALIRGTSTHPLAGLISGSLDLDKIDYLKRDALMSGVPYGEIDVDRLLACLVVVDEDGRRSVGILEKGLTALESLLFAKYQMYRNVYWHHAVRSATAMFKRLVREATATRALDAEQLADATDDALVHDLVASDRTGLALALRERRLHKRALEIAPADLPAPVPAWVGADAARLARAEDALAAHLGLCPGEVLVDFPHKAAMLGVDLAIVRREGGVDRLGRGGWPGRMDLPRLADDLAESARRLRVFTARPVTVRAADLYDVLAGEGTS